MWREQVHGGFLRQDSCSGLETRQGGGGEVRLQCRDGLCWGWRPVDGQFMCDICTDGGPWVLDLDFIPDYIGSHWDFGFYSQVPWGVIGKVWYDSCWRKDNCGFFECFEKKVGSHDWKWALVLSRNKGAWTGVGLMEAGEMARFSTFKSIVSKHHWCGCEIQVKDNMKIFLVLEMDYML